MRKRPTHNSKTRFNRFLLSTMKLLLLVLATLALALAAPGDRLQIGVKVRSGVGRSVCGPITQARAAQRLPQPRPNKTAPSAHAPAVGRDDGVPSCQTLGGWGRRALGASAGTRGHVDRKTAPMEGTGITFCLRTPPLPPPHPTQQKHFSTAPTTAPSKPRPATRSRCTTRARCATAPSLTRRSTAANRLSSRWAPGEFWLLCGRKRRVSFAFPAIKKVTWFVDQLFPPFPNSTAKSSRAGTRASSARASAKSASCRFPRNWAMGRSGRRPKFRPTRTSCSTRKSCRSTASPRSSPDEWVVKRVFVVGRGKENDGLRPLAARMVFCPLSLPKTTRFCLLGITQYRVLFVTVRLNEKSLSVCNNFCAMDRHGK